MTGDKVTRQRDMRQGLCGLTGYEMTLFHQGQGHTQRSLFVAKLRGLIMIKVTGQSRHDL